MNLQEHLLTCLSEECAEVIYAVSKSLRFGLNDIPPNSILTNTDHIALECTDLLAVIELLEDMDIIIVDRSSKAFLEKKQKIERFTKRAVENGTLII